MGKSKKESSKTRDAPTGSGGKSAARRLALAVDVVVFTTIDSELRVLLIRRSSGHHEGEWALPGGFVGAEEPLETAAQRELREETGLAPEPTHLEQLRTYGAPGRDDRPDLRVVSVAYLAIQPGHPEPVANSNAADARWEPVELILTGDVPLAFDHTSMVIDAVNHLRHELEQTAVATAFLGDAFTEAQLRTVYEAVWGAGRVGGIRLDAPNFHRSVATSSPPIVEPVPGTQAATGGRPAALYRPSTYVREGGPSVPLERALAQPRTGTTRRQVH